MIPVSVIIPTYNEEENLRELLPLVQWADEVLVIDSFSTDGTCQVAESLGATLRQHEYEYSAAQKNRAIQWVKNDWILLIDADERPTKDLILEIQTMLYNPSIPHQAYWIRRQNYFMGQKIRFSGWQNDAVIRFFNRSSCQYEDKKVHAEIQCNGSTSRLKAVFKHYTYRDMDHFMEKMERYAAWSAVDHASKTKKVTVYHLSIKPIARFLKHFILKGGIFDGTIGFKISKIMAWGVRRRYLLLKEMQQE